MCQGMLFWNAADTSTPLGPSRNFPNSPPKPDMWGDSRKETRDGLPDGEYSLVNDLAWRWLSPYRSPKLASKETPAHAPRLLTRLRGLGWEREGVVGRVLLVSREKVADGTA